MRENVASGVYGKNTELLSNMYNDFILILDNCTLYNDEGSEVAVEADRVMAHLPESFANT